MVFHQTKLPLVFSHFVFIYWLETWEILVHVM